MKLKLFNVRILKLQEFLAHQGFVERFIPRIPSRQMPGENSTIPRVCMSQDFLGCIYAVPGLRDIVNNKNREWKATLLVNGEELEGCFVAIHEFFIDELDPFLMSNRKICEQELVPDVDNTGEQWYLGEISPDDTYYLFIPDIETVTKFGILDRKKVLTFAKDFKTEEIIKLLKGD